MVKNKTLLLIASFVWTLAGVNILRIGLRAALLQYSLLDFFASAIIFILFGRMFYKIVQKHTLRIHHFEKPKQYFWNFFDLKSFIIMAIMMSSGILIRSMNLMPEVCIATFYSGLGLALSLAGVKFLHNYFQYAPNNGL